MKRFALIALMAAACAPQTAPANADGSSAVGNLTEASAEPAPPPVGTLRECDGSKADALVGRVMDSAAQAEAKRLVGAGLIRVIPPGAAVTMDYRGDRLNIETDAANKALRFRCG